MPATTKTTATRLHHGHRAVRAAAPEPARLPVDVQAPPAADCPAAWLRPVRWDLAACLRRHRVTVRDLATEAGLTVARVRALRRQTTFPWTDALGLYDAILAADARR
jgi:hypothetical protein